MSDHTKSTVLLTGASGYVGGRLLQALEREGWETRCMTRDIEVFKARMGDEVDCVYGDVTDPESLEKALDGIDIAYYLVHSMGSNRSFIQTDRDGARNFARAARSRGVGRIIYLGGLGRGEKISAHLASRQEVGRILREEGPPTIEFRASIIIGSGSLSFELVRRLTERLPLMITPRWTRNLAQPIAIEDVIEYLVQAGRTPVERGEVFEIGGPDPVSYIGLMREYARLRGLRRVMIPVPVLTPWLSSLWLQLVTPVYARIGRKIIDGVKVETVVQDDRALGVFDLRPMGYQKAMRRALENEDAEIARTRWSDAVSASAPDTFRPQAPVGARLIDSRRLAVDLPPERAFGPVRKIGGSRGWYFGDFLWRIRGWLDLLVGGVGMRRGRPDPDRPKVGDPLDFWRVEDYQPDRLLRLRAEMRLPGRAWLQFEVRPTDGGGSEIIQTALFDPFGVWGRLYWYSLLPLHGIVFSGMLKAIARRAREEG